MQVFAEAFLGTLTAGGILVVVLKFLGSKFLEHQLSKALSDHNHELDKKLAALESGLARLGDVVSRRNEREFAVTEVAWERMIEAVGAAQSELAGHFPAIIFGKLSEREALDVIDGLAFTSAQKAALREAAPKDRQTLHHQYSLEHGTERVRKTWREFRNWLTTRQIFMSPAIYAGFEGVAEHLWKSVVTLSHHGDEETRKLERRAAYLGLDGLEPKIDELAKLILRHFEFEDSGSR